MKVPRDLAKATEEAPIDLSKVQNLNELTKEEQRSILEGKFNLHFPKTTFNQRKNHEFNQERFQSLLTYELYNWQYFTRGPQAKSTNNGQQHPTWVLHDGPPFASGKSHVGNFYNKVLKDIVNRYKLLRGYRVHYIPGFDCFGNNTEDAFAADKSLLKVKKLNLSLRKNAEGQERRQLSDKEQQVMDTRSVVESGVKDSMMLQMSELQQWGIMTDWRYSYFTLMPSYQAMVLRVFGQFMRKGLVFRGDRPIFWSVEGQRVLAEDEMIR